MGAVGSITKKIWEEAAADGVSLRTFLKSNSNVLKLFVDPEAVDTLTAAFDPMIGIIPAASIVPKTPKAAKSGSPVKAEAVRKSRVARVMWIPAVLAS